MRKQDSAVSRRKFLKTSALAAGVATTGAIAMPNVSRAQTVTLKCEDYYNSTG